MLKLSKKNHPVIAFFMGLLSVNNIAYTFVVGTTPIMVSCVYAVVCLLYLLLIHDKSLIYTIYNIPQQLWLFLLFVFLSFVTIAVIHYQYLYQWLVGVVQLLLYCSIALLVATLSNNKNDLLDGIFWGIIINFGFVVYSYLMYRRGVIFSLNDVFPAVHMKVLYIGNTFRGWGLFREPGHLMRYLCVLSFIVWDRVTYRPVIYKVMLFLSLAVLIMLSISSAVIFFLLGIVIFINLNGKRNYKIFIGSIILLVAIVVLTIALSKRNQFVSLLVASFEGGLLDIFITSGGNATRYSGFDYVFRIIKKYPIIGSGWNTLTQEFINEGYYGVGKVRGSYSEGLSLIAEMGIFCIPFFVFICKSIIKTGKSKNSFSNALCTCLIMYILLLFATDYSIDAGAAILIGLTMLSFRMGGQFDGIDELDKKNSIS